MGVRLMAHRVAWAIYYGVWPTGMIDHINGDGLDNRICNLRDVTHKENARNSRRKATNKSGCSGVMRDKHKKKWVAQSA